MDSEEQARREAEQAANDERLDKLAERIGAHATARAVFGDPVERDGLTVIPVARVRYGFGGGSGRGGARGRGRNGDGGVEADEEQYGSGAGGGVQAGPIGYIELRDGEACFTRIADPVRVISLLTLPLAALALGAVVLWLGRDRLFPSG
jgi:uncharacterized spore protein YtfJ